MMSHLKKITDWLDDRLGYSENIRPLIKHLAPPRAKWAYVFGSATLFCLIVQVVTGIGLSLLYQPSSGLAFQSLNFITNQAAFGKVLRAIHFYGASGMVLMAGIHMTQVYISASYKYPREMSWVSGVILLLMTIGMGFTGQLLRWDANGVWSSVVAAEQMGRMPVIGKYVARLLLGGDSIGGHTLSRFYSYHVFVIPAMLFGFVGLHLYLVFKNGISEPPKAGRLVNPKTYRSWYANMLKEKGVPFWPDAAWRDTLFGALVVLAIVALAILIGPPALTSPPDPAHINTQPMPDWYMVPFFSLFALMPPAIESWVIFLAPPLIVLSMLSLPFLSNKGERSPVKRPWAVFGVISVAIFMTCLLIIGYKAPWSPVFDAKPIPLSAIHGNPKDSLIQNGTHLFYIKGCEYCHQINGYGGLKGPNLTNIGNRLDIPLIKIRIVNGGPDMPAFGGTLSRDEVDALAYFLSQQK
jgi:ubiquinol-cytochrome c reductase cytochrome b subunit